MVSQEVSESEENIEAEEGEESNDYLNELIDNMEINEVIRNQKTGN